MDMTTIEQVISEQAPPAEPIDAADHAGIPEIRIVDDKLYDPWTCSDAEAKIYSNIETRRQTGSDDCTMTDESREYYARDGFVFLERVVLKPGPDFKNLVERLDRIYGAIHWDSEGPHVVAGKDMDRLDRNYKLFISPKRLYVDGVDWPAFELFIRHTMPAKDYWERKLERSQF